MLVKNIVTPKLKQITFVVLLIVAIPFNIIVIDRYFFPKQIISDNIISAARVIQTRNSKFGSSKSTRGYIYNTDKGFEFLTDKDYISDLKINIEQTIIFKNIVSVCTEEGNKVELLTGLGGINGYFYLILAMSTTISICFLKLKPEVSDNEFLNIILFNGFMIFVLLIIWTLI
jgi:hypothetical protein